VLVSEQGAAVSVQLQHSCGFARLDDAALDAVRQWRFVPAKRGAEAIEEWVLVPIAFRLDA
jgi:protein TonB